MAKVEFTDNFYDNTFKSVIANDVDLHVDILFNNAHNYAGTKTGDTTPSQHERLENLKDELVNLIFEQVKQNL